MSAPDRIWISQQGIYKRIHTARPAQTQCTEYQKVREISSSAQPEAKEPAKAPAPAKRQMPPVKNRAAKPRVTKRAK